MKWSLIPRPFIGKSVNLEGYSCLWGSLERLPYEDESRNHRSYALAEQTVLRAAVSLIRQSIVSAEVEVLLSILSVLDNVAHSKCGCPMSAGFITELLLSIFVTTTWFN